MKTGKAINILIKHRLAGIMEFKKTNLSQISLGMGKSHTYLSSTLNADSSLNVGLVFELAKILDCEISEILPNKEEISRAIKSN